ncbi:hypothetical protein VNO78_13755 [Psophocarpus tetragonolobus]|uniref:Protein NDR1-like n=1 Tax=Psophocarpus tetragonolobus TaxID=3891 RepID=A0AAN9XPQ2_PSOTE
MAVAHESCCSRCITFLITIGFMALFLWLSLRVNEPKCYLDSIYVPALNKTLNSTHKNTTILFALKLANGNKDKGIRYDDVQLSFKVFVSMNDTRPLGNATVQNFYQGHQKKATKRGNFTAAFGNLTAAVAQKVWYRVDYNTTAKYKILFWYTKRHRLWGGANVEMNDSGLKVYAKPIKLGGNNPLVIESVAPNLLPHYRALLTFVIAAFLFLNACAFS